jgi:hypothetical protein
MVPHGYLPIDLDPSTEQVDALFEGVRSLPAELRRSAERMLRFYGGFLWALDAQRAEVCMLGLHPLEDGEPALSVITISTVPTSGSRPELVIANMAGTVSERPEDGIVPLELPCGTAFFDERTRRTAAPGVPRDGSGTPIENIVWQGTVVAPGPDRASVVALQLVTPAVGQSEDYRNILLGVAHTLTYTDPSSTESDESGQEAALKSSAAEAVRNDFG